MIEKNRVSNNNKTVVNRSNTTHSPAETSLVEKGLSYCPRPPRVDTFQLNGISSSSREV